MVRYVLKKIIRMPGMMVHTFSTCMHIYIQYTVYDVSCVHCDINYHVIFLRYVLLCCYYMYIYELCKNYTVRSLYPSSVPSTYFYTVAHHQLEPNDIS